MSGPKAIYELKCSCNQYPWGKTGKESLSATLCAKQPGWGDDGPKSDFKLDEKTPYAEMWMGTYPVLPSYVKETGEDLQDVIDAHPKELLGQELIDRFGHTKLPYLPKVLSIAKALPLQLHPNKSLAAKLHEKDPQNFTDPNHKPEIALALGRFEAFCGFKPLADINALMQLDCLQRYLPKGAKPEFDDQQLKGVVRNMLEADDSTVKETYTALTSLPASEFGKDTYIPSLAPRLAEQYSEADPGTLVALITMNFLTLDAGQGIYIPADGIHAYLSGDIIECMARSNNVLNTGFCPRAERNSIDLFCSTLTFTPHTPEECMLHAEPYKGAKEGKTTLFQPPLSEFDMLAVELKKGEKETLVKTKGPAILLATRGNASLKANGEAVDLREGTVFFVAPGVELEFEAGGEGLLAHAAFVQ